MSKAQQQVLANDLLDTSTATASSEVKKFEANPVAIILIFILFTSLTVNAQKIRRTWSIVTSVALIHNEAQEYPKAIIGIPLLILICMPAIASLFVIQFRTFYTLLTDEHDSCEPLDLVNSEEQRQLLLLPLAVSGMVMSILPAYYFHYKKYYGILVSQGLLGLMLLLLFLGIALIPQHGNSLLITIKEKE